MPGVLGTGSGSFEAASSACSSSDAATNTICPLCGAGEARTLDKIPSSKVWAALESEHHAVFTAAERKGLSPEAGWDLLECGVCKLQFFDPASPGDGAFYERLSEADRYYVADKWDFHAALKHLRRGDKVLDIACGSGRFVELAGEHGAVPVGIDTNPDAVASAKARGLDIRLEGLDRFATSHAAAFDAVTAFQVVEHVPLPVEFIVSGAKCLRSGGLLIVTVPNVKRAVRNSFEALDCPPHHLSRWGAAQLETLGAGVGLALVTHEQELAEMFHCRLALRDRLFGPAHSSGVPARLIGFMAFNRITYPVLRGSGALAAMGLWGHSLLAVYRKV